MLPKYVSPPVKRIIALALPDTILDPMNPIFARSVTPTFLSLVVNFSTGLLSPVS